MSITSALSSALSGLQAASRQSEVIASNVANASTPGYGRRSIELTSLYLGGSGQGVRVVATNRTSDLYLQNERRFAQADTGNSAVKSQFYTRIESILGTTETGDSLVNRLNNFESDLLIASGNPEIEILLTKAVQSGVDLANGLNIASKNIQNERLAADKSINVLVSDLNTSLAELEALNKTVATFTGLGRDISSLLDKRQQVIDAISDIVPLREVLRDHNQIALVTQGGAVLLDGKAAVFEFSPVQTMDPELSLVGGSLSGLKLNGMDVATQGTHSLIKGGSLAALFEVRDVLAVSAQDKVDGYAQDLLERFSAAGLDPSLTSGDPGLFTDWGAALDVSHVTGLAGRIEVNNLLINEAGGSVTRLRDGLGASATVQKGNSALLTALVAALNNSTSTSSPAFTSGSRTAFSLASDLLSHASTQRVYSQQEQSFRASRLYALADLEAAQAVDVDTEMQALLIVEKNYAANAKVIQAVDEMLTILLGM